MLIPISKQLEDNAGKKSYIYNLYDVETKKILSWTTKEIEEAIKAEESK